MHSSAQLSSGGLPQGEWRKRFRSDLAFENDILGEGSELGRVRLIGVKERDRGTEGPRGREDAGA